MSNQNDSFETAMLANEFATARFAQLTNETRFGGSEVANNADYQQTTGPHIVKKLRQQSVVQTKKLPNDPSKWTTEERVGVEQLARLGHISEAASKSLCRGLLPHYEVKNVLEMVKKYKEMKGSEK